MDVPIHFKEICDASPHASILLGGDFTVLHANASCLCLSGRQLSEIVGRNIFEVFPGNETGHDRNTEALLRESFTRAAATHRSESLPVFRYAVQRATPAGNVFDERFWTGMFTPIFDRGKLFCICFTLVDMTEIELLKQRLFDSKAVRSGQAQPQAGPIGQVMQTELSCLHHLSDRAPGFFAFLRGPQHVFEIANKTAYQLLGHRPLIGKPLRQAVAEAEGQQHAALLGQVYRSGQPIVKHALPVQLQYYPGARPTQVYVDFVYQPVLGADGSITGVLVQGYEVTEQVHAQHELYMREERWKLALEAGGNAVWDYNPQTDHLVYSENWKDMLGYSEEEIGSNVDAWKKFVHPDDLLRVLRDIQACLEEAAPIITSEYRVRCKDGSWKWILVRGAVIRSGGKAVRMIGTNMDISEKKQSEHEIWRRANFDLLTGLPNRRLYQDRLAHEVAHAHRTGLPLALLFIDLDRFKEANDWLGHSAGDQLLQQAAERICGVVRKSDTVARLGGDEFTVILPELDHVAHVEQIAQKILGELARPFQVRDEVVEVSGSIGITLFPADATEPEDLSRHADQAMYVAKNAGRNQFRFFTQSMQELAAYRRVLIGELREAVRERQLQLYLQPIIDLSDGCIMKAEALVRWQHPRRGLLSPTEFIALAEETGLIHEIGDWVFSQSASCAQRWSTQLGLPFQISVNKSPAQFAAHAKGKGIDWVAFLRRLGLAGNHISMEITEGLLLNASESVAKELLSLRDAGVQVAIDDFGTGYSSMAYLKKFDVDYLKIDQSFVRDTTTTSSTRTIAETIIVMAHKLGLKVIAEGVETAEQRDWLKSAGCDFAQGYLFSRPVPPMEFERLINIGNATHCGF